MLCQRHGAVVAWWFNSSAPTVPTGRHPPATQRSAALPLQPATDLGDGRGAGGHLSRGHVGQLHLNHAVQPDAHEAAGKVQTRESPSASDPRSTVHSGVRQWCGAAAAARGASACWHAVLRCPAAGPAGGAQPRQARRAAHRPPLPPRIIHHLSGHISAPRRPMPAAHSLPPLLPPRLPSPHVIQLLSGHSSATAGRRIFLASSGNRRSSHSGSHTNSISTASPCAQAGSTRQGRGVEGGAPAAAPPGPAPSRAVPTAAACAGPAPRLRRLRRKATRQAGKRG